MGKDAGVPGGDAAGEVLERLSALGCCKLSMNQNGMRTLKRVKEQHSEDF
jgi:hypothetical protein